MGLFKKRDKYTLSPSENRKLAEKVASRELKYASTREGDVDTVISKGGVMHIKDGVFTVFSGAEYGSKTVFSCYVDNMKISELMSLEGAILEGPDLSHGGKTRKIIVYYVYYIK